MRRIALICASAPAVAMAQELVAVRPEASMLPLVILFLCVAAIVGAIVLKRRYPAIYAKLDGGAKAIVAEVKPTAQHLEDEAKLMIEALNSHPLAQPKNPAQVPAPPAPVYVPPVARPAVLELPHPIHADDGILR